MFNREQLQAISGLKLTGKLEQMDDAALDMYVLKLVAFIDGFPAREKELKTALEAKDADAVSKCLTTVWDMLMKIHADAVAEECLQKIEEIKAMTSEEIEAYMTGFLSVLAALSIDIQMAVYRDQREGEGVPFGKGDGRSISILAVDDRAFFLANLKTFLQDARHKLTCVTSGDVALRFLQSHTPDLFILDIEMPGMDGYELARRIREMGKTAPIIFLTGNAKKEYVVKAIQAGAADFIVKPISKEQVLEKISKYA